MRVAGVGVGGVGSIGVRPESIALVAPGQGQVQAKVELIEALGAETLIYVSTDSGAPLVARLNTRTDLHVGSAVGVHIDGDSAHLFDANGRVVVAP